jgi:Ca2+-binding EF-hand superfamily protein
VFDKNGDGAIDIEDIVALTKHFDERLSEEEMIDMLAAFENNFDKCFSFESQFANYLLLRTYFNAWDLQNFYYFIRKI